ncbi:MAG: hypothetical protein U0S49_10785 [Rhodospirillales bacterium]|nr:hypothetical protein [Rhodospirillales bacterium]
MSLLEVLINPRGREHELSQRGQGCSTANVAGIGESQLKQRSGVNRLEGLPPRGLVDRPFTSFASRRCGRLDADHPAPWSYDHGRRRRAHPVGGAR